MVTMRAARYYGPRDIRIEEVARPVPAPGDLLVRVHANGICGTDASEYVEGPLMYPLHHRHALTGHRGPLVPGHEFCGFVADAGPGVHGFASGDLVITGGALWCGTCRQCRAGRTSICELYATVGLHCDGGLAEYVRLPAHIAVRADPFGLRPDVAVLAQPMAIAVHALRRSGVRAGDDAVVIGVGGIGAFLTYALVQAGVRVAAVDVRADRLRNARQLGAHTVVTAPPATELRDALLQAGIVPTTVFEVTGTAGGLAAATAAVEPGGRVVAVGIAKGVLPADMRRITTKEVEIVGTNALIGREDVPEAARLLSIDQDRWHEIAPVAIPLEHLVRDGIAPIAGGSAPAIKMLVDPSIDRERSTLAGVLQHQ